MQVADSLVTERYAMFQLGVRGVRSSQLLSDRHRGLVALQGQFHIALSKLRLGNLFLAGRKILLPPGARGVDVDQLLSDRRRRQVALQRLVRLAQGLLHIANPVVANRQVPLPMCVLGIQDCLSQSCGSGFDISLERLVIAALANNWAACSSWSALRAASASLTSCLILSLVTGIA